MFTKKEINTLKALSYASSCANGIGNVEAYRHTYDNALSLYFQAFPNDDVPEEVYSDGDFPIDEN